MKKLIALLLALCIVMALAACGGNNGGNGSQETTTEATTEGTTEGTTTGSEVKVMTHAEFMAAQKDDVVCVETYVQATRSWWNNAICVYAQNEEGGCFIYDMACSEADAAKLVPGTKIRVTGDKAIYDGEHEIMNGTFEFVEGATPYVAEAFDATAMLGTAELEKHMNELASFKGLKFESLSYKGGATGDDIYVTLSKDGTNFDFCVEVYLTGPNTDVYKTVEALKAGDIVNITGFLYWYNGANPHITAISLAEATNS